MRRLRPEPDRSIRRTGRPSPRPGGPYVQFDAEGIARDLRLAGEVTFGSRPAGR